MCLAQQPDDHSTILAFVVMLMSYPDVTGQRRKKNVTLTVNDNQLYSVMQRWLAH